MKLTSKTSKSIQKVFLDNKGYLRVEGIEGKTALYNTLKELIDAGKVVKLKPGLYKMPALQAKSELEEIQMIYKQGVFCLFTAWHYYELTTHIPVIYYLTFPNKAKVRIFEYPPIEPHYWSNKYYSCEIRHIDGIQIYSLENLFATR